MSTKHKKIENSSHKYKSLRKNLIKQSTDTILEWKRYFENCKSKPKHVTEYFLMAINVCDDILRERMEK